MSSRELIYLTEHRDDSIRRSRYGETTQAGGSRLEHGLFSHMPFLALHVALYAF